MSVKIAFIADPHLCIEARRQNLFSLSFRKPAQNVDVLRNITGRFSSSGLNALIKPTSYDEGVLEAAADFVEEIATELDMLVILGDLATTGLLDDLNVAKEIFLSEGVKEHLDARLNPRFGGLGIPLHVIPGNHDRYLDDYGMPGCKNFDIVFKTVYSPKDGVCFSEIENDGILVGLASADFCFVEGSQPNILQRYGRGEVNNIVLRELENRTRAWKDSNPGMPVVWALHFSVADDVPYLLELNQKNEVLSKANLLGVKHIFGGHTHERKRQIGSHPHIYSAGSVSSIDSRDNHYIHVCEVKRDFSGEYVLELFDFKFDSEFREFVFSEIDTSA
nr:metallophosphoesterase [uncultured Cohaesibacter sp.]